jgi:hypothetical protein
VFVAIAKDVKSTNYISISCDGVTNVDNQSQLSLHTCDLRMNLNSQFWCPLKRWLKGLMLQI